MLPAHSCGENVLGQRTADTLNLVGRYGYADSGSAADDSELIVAVGQEAFAGLLCHIGIIHRLLGVHTKVIHPVSPALKMFYQLLFDLYCAVIIGDNYSLHTTRL